MGRSRGVTAILVLVVLIVGGLWWSFGRLMNQGRVAHEFVDQVLTEVSKDWDPESLMPYASETLRTTDRATLEQQFDLLGEHYGRFKSSEFLHWRVEVGTDGTRGELTLNTVFRHRRGRGVFLLGGVDDGWQLMGFDLE